MKNVFDVQIENNQEIVKGTLRDTNLLFAARIALADIAELDDVSCIGIYPMSCYVKDENGYEEYRVTGSEITFYLKESAKDSKLVHKLAQRFGCKFEKTPGWDGKSLVATATTEDKKWKFEIRGYVPATCALVTEEIELTAE